MSCQPTSKRIHPRAAPTSLSQYDGGRSEAVQILFARVLCWVSSSVQRSHVSTSLSRLCLSLCLFRRQIFADFTQSCPAAARGGKKREPEKAGRCKSTPAYDLTKDSPLRFLLVNGCPHLASVLATSSYSADPALGVTGTRLRLGIGQSGRRWFRRYG